MLSKFLTLFFSFFRKKAVEVGFYFVLAFGFGYFIVTNLQTDKKDCKNELRYKDSIYRVDTWALIKEIETCKSNQK
jgi:hypothetical protein